MAKILLANGDSWAYGSEIACPEILNIIGPEGYGKPNRYKPGKYDTFAENDYYRIPRIWPTKLAQLLNYEVQNISWPARCNDNIVSSTQRWVFDFINSGGNTDEVFAVIGWSSPERKQLIIDDVDKLHYQTMWPAQAEDQFYTSDALKKFAPFYKRHLYVEAEYLERFITQVYTLHVFLKMHNIQHIFFNSFYHYDKSFHEPHTDINLQHRLDKMLYDYQQGLIGGWHEETFSYTHRISLLKNMWDSVPSSVFMFKDTFRSFKSVIHEFVPHNQCMINMHPSPEGHSLWANYLYGKLTNNENSYMR